MSADPEAFALDARLAADALVVGDWPLCRVLLMDEARCVWLILVPRRPGLREIIDLAGPDRARLWDEICAASQAVRDFARPDKLNVASLGNVVAQLHVHVIGRRAGDYAWPGPTFGIPRVPLDAEAARGRLAALRSRLATA